MGGWSVLWSTFLAQMAREPVQVNILLVLAMAFIAVMAIEGIRSSFFPRRTVATMPKPQAESDTTGDSDSHSAHAAASLEPMPLAAPRAPAAEVKRVFPRRSSPPLPRILRVRKPS